MKTSFLFTALFALIHLTIPLPTELSIYDTGVSAKTELLYALKDQL
jgi:hypothetical protein